MLKVILLVSVVSFLLLSCGERSVLPINDGDSESVNDQDATTDALSDYDEAVSDIQENDEEPDDAVESEPVETDQVVPDEDADIDKEWTPVEPKRDQRGKYIIVWLSGTPYEMGYQHGMLLKSEIQNGLENSEYIKDLKWQITLASYAQLDSFAQNNSYPDIVEECQGMVDAVGDIGWTMELCLIANFGDVMVEWLDSVVPVKSIPHPGCSQFMVSGEATSDGRLYHGRLLDWDEVDFLLWYPVIFVRQPIDGIPHVYIGFPGNLSPYSGMNIAGISGASNESDPFDKDQQAITGRSHVQMLGQILKRSSSIEEANQFILGEKHMSVEQFGLTDANAGIGANFEMTAKAVARRDMKNGAVWMSNHFVDPSTEELDADPAGSSSLKRFKRLEQLLTPDSEYSLHGTLSPETMVNVLRDRIDPDTMIESPLGTLDDDSSLATNGAIYAIIFDPGNLFFWVASGEIPVPEQQFVGFSLSDLLDLPDEKPVTPEVID